MVTLDEKDIIILDTLFHDCRTSLTQIAEKVHLSIDATKKRITKMQQAKVFSPQIRIRPQYFGYKNIVEVKAKLIYKSLEAFEALINHLKQEPQVTEIFSIIGEWELSFVVISKDSADFSRIIEDIKKKHCSLISALAYSTTIKAHKFEEYNLKKLIG